jgi:hypothetical protein
MLVESDRAAARPPVAGLVVGEERIVEYTLEEADEARRRAAEHGDYVTAERWLWHERLLTDQEARTEQP